MYNIQPAFVLGFHGLDQDIAFQILNQKTTFDPSNNDYDWLGEGVYFWENNLERAKQYAVEDSQRRSTKIKTPFVLGAVIDLGNCLDLLNQDGLDFLAFAYQEFALSLSEQNMEMPANQSFTRADFDFKKRQLDCAVIRYAHSLAEKNGKRFDTVRAVFWEGESLYEGAGFKRYNHIQIAVLNPNCIKGIFLPREQVAYP